MIPYHSNSYELFCLFTTAQCSARAAHELEGIPYVGHEIDVQRDIHFSVVRITLPLGSK